MACCAGFVRGAVPQPFPTPFPSNRLFPLIFRYLAPAFKAFRSIYLRTGITAIDDCLLFLNLLVPTFLTSFVLRARTRARKAVRERDEQRPHETKKLTLAFPRAQLHAAHDLRLPAAHQGHQRGHPDQARHREGERGSNVVVLALNHLRSFRPRPAPVPPRPGDPRRAHDPAPRREHPRGGHRHRAARARTALGRRQRRRLTLMEPVACLRFSYSCVY
jgi:hypothetical protein